MDNQTLFLKAILTHCAEGVVAFDTNFKILLWNRTSEVEFQKPEEDSLGKSLFESLPFLTKLKPSLQRVLKGHSLQLHPFHIPGKNNQVQHYEIHFAPLKLENLKGGLLFFSNITKKIETQKSAIESELRFQTMVDTAPVMLWMAREDGLRSYFNQSWLNFTGQTLEQEWGVGWAEGVYFEDFQSCMDKYLHSFNKREPFEMEYRLKRKDGKYRWILDKGHPRFTHENQFSGYIGSCIDITDRKISEVSLTESRESAIQSSQMKSRFLANVSHELRTPLNGIMGLTGLLLKTELTPEQLNYLKILQASEKILLTLVNEILDFDKIESRRIKLSYSDFSITVLIQDIVRLLTPKALSYHNDLSFHISPRLAKLYRGDPGRIRQVLVNLIGNAIKFTKNGKVKITATLLPSRRILFDVSDTGIGIPPDGIPKLFKPYSQLETAISRHKGGSGLGLAISKQLISLMKGKIEVVSKVGVGSRFWFSLPLEASQVVENPHKKSRKRRKPKSQISPAAMKDLHPILIVEDNAVNRMVIDKQLESVGYQVKAVDSGEKALKLFSKHSYSAVLMDCQMPGMDGYETARRMRELHPGNRSTPIIAITAHAFSGEKQRCIDAGMDDCLSKPITTKKLCRILETYIGRRRFNPKLPPSTSNFHFPSPKEEDPCLLDPEAGSISLLYLRKLEAEHGIDFLIEILSIYLKTAEVHFKNLEVAFETSDFTNIRRQAHTLKSSSKHVGAVPLAELLEELEHNSDSPVKSSEPLIVKIRCEYLNAKTDLIRILNQKRRGLEK